MARLAHANRFLVTDTRAAAFTDQGGTFESWPPLSNLGKMQLPLKAIWDGATFDIDCQAQDAAGAAESFDADTFAVLGLEGVEEEAVFEFLDGATSLGTVNYADAPVGRGGSAVLELSAPVSLDTLTVQVTGAGTGAHSIGAVFAGLSREFDPSNDLKVAGRSSGVVSRSLGLTPWGFRGDGATRWPIRTVTEDPESWASLLSSIGVTSPVLFTIDRKGSRYAEIYGLINGEWRIGPLPGSVTLFDVSFDLFEAV